MTVIGTLHMVTINHLNNCVVISVVELCSVFDQVEDDVESKCLQDQE